VVEWVSRKTITAGDVADMRARLIVPQVKTVRGYKSVQGLLNGIALTQWLGSGAGEHQFEELLVA